MSDFKISLPGTETVTLTGQTIDKLIRAGDGDAALLYLYILRTNGESTSSEAAIALDKSKGWVNSAMALLSRLKLVDLDENTLDNITSNVVNTNPQIDKPEKHIEQAQTTPIRESREYSQDEVKHAIDSTDFAIVVDETQRKLGKILSPDDLLRLFGIYGDLRLPPEVILHLITHCINECRVTGDGRAPNIKYIEKAAFTWEREGIFTLERAEEYIKSLEAKRLARTDIRNILHIKNRDFSATEKRYVDGWLQMGFEADAIAIAYDITIVKTGNMAWPYMDTILKNWNSKGLKTAEQIMEKEKSLKARENSVLGKPNSVSNNEPSREEVARMTRILDKIKSG
jgi:DnaD/phage-associated family protein